MRQAKYTIASAVLFGLVGVAGLTTGAAAQENCDECWVVANPDGSVLRGSGIDDIVSPEEGVYNVRFRRKVDKCSWVGSIGLGIAGNADPGFISVSGRTAKSVQVKIFDTSAQSTTRPFHIQIECRE